MANEQRATWPVEMKCPRTGRWYQSKFRTTDPLDPKVTFESLTLDFGCCPGGHAAEEVGLRVGMDRTAAP